MAVTLDAREWHPVLRRQLARLGLREDAPPDEATWAKLLRRIEGHYRSADADRYLLERAIEQSSRELRELNDEATDARARIEGVLQSLPQAVLALDREGKVVLANGAAAELLDVTDDAIGRCVDEVIALGDPSGLLSAALVVASLTQGSQGFRIDDAWAGPLSGPAFPAAVQLRPVDGRRTVAVLTVQDDSAVHERERELRQAVVEAEVSHRTEQARGMFLANVSHELRTPLNAIIGYTEMLLEECLDRGQSNADLARVHTAASHLLGLINDILDLSKVDAGKMPVVIDHVDVADLLAEVADTMRPAIATRQNLLNTSAVDGEVIQTDVVKLKQCLFNLVANSAKFTHKGEIGIQAIVTGDVVQFVITDTGQGIAPGRLAMLFEPFEQERADTARHHGGTGLGLTIVKAYATLLGGGVSVQSELGQGSRFTLQIARRLVAGAQDPAD